MTNKPSRKRTLTQCPSCTHACGSGEIGQHLVEAHGPAHAIEWADSTDPTWRERDTGQPIQSMKSALQRLSRKPGPHGFPRIANPGDKVICVDQHFSGQVWEWTTALPNLWGIYTVQDVRWCPDGLTGVYGPGYRIKEMAPFLLGNLRFDVLHFVPLR